VIAYQALRDGGELTVENINPQLWPLVLPVERLHADPKNARKHGERNLVTIQTSLRAYGQQKPIVVLASGRIVAGNGTFAAAKALGWRYLAAVVYADEPSWRMYALADNRSAELAEWDYPELAAALREMQDDGLRIDELGWADYELEPLLNATFTPPPVEATEPDGARKGRAIKLTDEQYEVVQRAITAARQRVGAADLSEGRALELIAADYLAGNGAA
jgi:ParB-like chromosome segregation protein Spo0J